MRRRVFCLCLMVVPNWAFGQTWECREVMVPMRDGVELATDVYVPENQFEGPYPVLIERTPYNKRANTYTRAISSSAATSSSFRTNEDGTTLKERITGCIPTAIRRRCARTF